MLRFGMQFISAAMLIGMAYFEYIDLQNARNCQRLLSE
jgi:hypothetical protein